VNVCHSGYGINICESMFKIFINSGNVYHYFTLIVRRTKKEVNPFLILFVAYAKGTQTTVNRPSRICRICRTEERIVCVGCEGMNRKE